MTVIDMSYRATKPPNRVGTNALCSLISISMVYWRERGGEMGSENDIVANKMQLANIEDRTNLCITLARCGW